MLKDSSKLYKSDYGDMFEEHMAKYHTQPKIKIKAMVDNKKPWKAEKASSNAEKATPTFDEDVDDDASEEDEREVIDLDSTLTSEPELVPLASGANVAEALLAKIQPVQTKDIHLPVEVRVPQPQPKPLPQPLP